MSLLCLVIACLFSCQTWLIPCLWGDNMCQAFETQKFDCYEIMKATLN